MAACETCPHNPAAALPGKSNSPPNSCCETVIMVRLCVSSPPWQRQMEREPPHLPQKAVYRILSGESWRFLKFRFQVTAINLAGACLDQAGLESLFVGVHKRWVRCRAALFRDLRDSRGRKNEKCTRTSLAWRECCLKKGKKRKKGEVVGHQCVNKLPHSVNQPGETGADPPVVKSLWGLLAYTCAMGLW